MRDHHLIFGLSLLLATSCGEPFRDVYPSPPPDAAGTEASAHQVPAVPAQPTLSFVPVKLFQIDWAAVATATHYRVFEDADGASGFQQIADGLAEPTYGHLVPLWMRTNARYVVQACNQAGCSANSAPVTVPSASALTPAIGYFKASNAGEHDRFGSAVRLSADASTMIVGAPEEDSGSNENDNSKDGAGAAYVFTHEGPTWTQAAYLKASVAKGSAWFGTSVATSSDGSTLAIGATGEDGGAGAVYVFVRSGNIWIEQARLKASNTDASDYFGEAVALSGDGDTLVVGANGEDGATGGVDANQLDNSAEGAGAVYVFSRTGTAWVQQAYLKAKSPKPLQGLGETLALAHDGSVLAVGALGDDSNCTGINCVGASSATKRNSGAVHVFARKNSVWSYQTFIKAHNADNGDRFGGVALSGDGKILAVGATGEDHGTSSDPGDKPQSSSGAVYLFASHGETWLQQAYIEASNHAETDYFGTSVALGGDGNTLVVGAYGEDGGVPGINGNTLDNSQDRSGAAYVFQRRGDVWQQSAYLKALRPQAGMPGDSFGSSCSVSADGETIAVAALRESGSGHGIGGDPNSLTSEESGAVYLY